MFGMPQLASPSFSDAAGWGAAIQRWSSIYPTDIDGDGSDDLCGRAAAGVVCALSDGEGLFQAETLWLAHFTDAQGFGLRESTWATLQFVDVTGDGATDVCARTSLGIECAVSNGSDGFADATVWSDELADGSGWESAAAYWGTVQFPDVDGDGARDVCGRRWDGMWCGLSNGVDGFDSEFRQDLYRDAAGWSAAAQYWGTIQFPDLNGDGKADICGRAVAGAQCGLSTGARFEGGLWSDVFNDSVWTAASRWGSTKHPDVNGDGMADVCSRGVDGIVCGVSNGVDSFDPITIWQVELADAAGWNVPERWATIQFPDLNGDGAEDICARDELGMLCALSNGVSGFGSLSHYALAFSDLEGWDAESMWRTIQFPTLTRQGCAASAGWMVPWRSSALTPRFMSTN